MNNFDLITSSNSKTFKENSKYSFGILKLKKGWNKITFLGSGKAEFFMKSKTNKNIYQGSINSTQYIYLTQNKYAYAYIMSYDESNIEKLVIQPEENNTLINEFPKYNNLIITHDIDDIGFWKFLETSETEKMKYDVLFVKQNMLSKIQKTKNTNVFEGNYSDLRELLMFKHYDNIVFWNYNYESLKSIIKCDYHNTTIYFKEFLDKNLYLNYEVFQRIYGTVYPKMSSAKTEELLNLKNIFQNLNYSRNCIFLFDSENEKNFFTTKLNIEFNHYKILPTKYIVEADNIYSKKRNFPKRIAIFKELNEFSRNAVDVDQKILAELSSNSRFSKTSIDYYGSGKWKEILLKNIINQKNVNYINCVSPDDFIKKIKGQYDLVILSNRDYLNLELIYSILALGMPVIVNDSNLYNIQIPEQLIVKNNSIEEYINKIDSLLFDELYYESTLEKMSKAIAKIQDNSSYYDFLAMLKENKDYHLKSTKSKPVLSIIIPAYNVSKYVSATIWSLINQKNYNDIEILVINDGSKDNTLEVAQKIKNDLFTKDTSIIKIIDKENGGHGSVINRGLQEMTGKYVKIIDGDDTVNSLNLSDLIEKLKDENADVVLNNYKEDYIAINSEVPIRFYENLPINTILDFETLCKNKIFTYWGPLLPTATYNVQNLKKRFFKISEKIFYDDMEWNFNSIVNVNSVKYFDTFIYHHFIGRIGQSVTMDGLIKNYKAHRTMTINLIKLYKDNQDIPKYKKRFLFQNYVLKMIKTHYMLTIDYFQSPIPFREFENELKQYPEFYNNKDVISKKIIIYRKTNGNFKHFEFLLPIYRKIKHLLLRR